MKIILAPDKFKGCMTAPQAAAALAGAVRSVIPPATLEICPVADGGEGFVDTMLAALGGGEQFTQVMDPLGRPVAARWGMGGAGRASCVSMTASGRASHVSVTGTGPKGLGVNINHQAASGGVAVLEMAAASGLELLKPEERDPTRTSTFGTGQLLRAALDHGATRVIMGIGGSATTDGGGGAAQALGVQFIDRAGRVMPAPFTGGDLLRLAHLDLSKLDPRCRRGWLAVACDVANPLYGPQGAAHVYAPQKGATWAQVALLDEGLRRLADVVQHDLGLDIAHTPGAGAAGGLGYGLAALLAGERQPGVPLVLETIHFADRARGADLCLTGEGRLDGQSAQGKAVNGVARAAAELGVPTIALVGALGKDVPPPSALGLREYHEINMGLPLAESLRHGPELLQTTAQRVLQRWLTQR